MQVDNHINSSAFSSGTSAARVGAASEFTINGKTFHFDNSGMIRRGEK